MSILKNLYENEETKIIFFNENEEIMRKSLMALTRFSFFLIVVIIRGSAHLKFGGGQTFF